MLPMHQRLRPAKPSRRMTQPGRRIQGCKERPPTLCRGDTRMSRDSSASRARTTPPSPPGCSMPRARFAPPKRASLTLFRQARQKSMMLSTGKCLEHPSCHRVPNSSQSTATIFKVLQRSSAQTSTESAIHWRATQVLPIHPATPVFPSPQHLSITVQPLRWRRTTTATSPPSSLTNYPRCLAPRVPHRVPSHLACQVCPAPRRARTSRTRLSLISSVFPRGTPAHRALRRPRAPVPSHRAPPRAPPLSNSRHTSRPSTARTQNPLACPIFRASNCPTSPQRPRPSPRRCPAQPAASSSPLRARHLPRQLPPRARASRLAQQVQP